MKRLKDYIIHLLGGVTQKEIREFEHNVAIVSIRQAQWVALYEIKCYASSLNGKPADDWCKCMWEYIAENEKKAYDKAKSIDVSSHD